VQPRALVTSKHSRTPSCRASALRLAAPTPTLRAITLPAEVGDACKPALPQWVVAATTGVAVAYIAGDVLFRAWREARRPGGNVARVAAYAACFQGLGSLVLPSLLIHQVVHIAQHGFRRWGRCTRWGPALTGLAVIPALPKLVDEPLERALTGALEYAWPIAVASTASASGGNGEAAVALGSGESGPGTE
jgi:fission process protein 1